MKEDSAWTKIKRAGDAFHGVVLHSGFYLSKTLQWLHASLGVGAVIAGAACLVSGVAVPVGGVLAFAAGCAVAVGCAGYFARSFRQDIEARERARSSVERTAAALGGIEGRSMLVVPVRNAFARGTRRVIGILSPSREQSGPNIAA